jgi:predicted transcriptional regulator
MLSRLEKKGFLRHKLIEQTYVYTAAVQPMRLRRSALRQLVKTFFNNSPVSAASALLGMEEQIDPEALDELERLIDKARREQLR